MHPFRIGRPAARGCLALLPLLLTLHLAACGGHTDPVHGGLEDGAVEDAYYEDSPVATVDASSDAPTDGLVRDASSGDSPSDSESDGPIDAEAAHDAGDLGADASDGATGSLDASDGSTSPDDAATHDAAPDTSGGGSVDAASEAGGSIDAGADGAGSGGTDSGSGADAGGALNTDAGGDSGKGSTVDAAPETGGAPGGDAATDTGGTSSVDAGSDASASSGPEAGVDAGVDSGIDSGLDAGIDATAIDATTSDGFVPCVAGSQCTTAEGAGICNASGLCATCISDTSCAAAYSAGYICVSAPGVDAGACVVGNCHSALNCVELDELGWVCENNSCAPCTATTQCQAEYGASDICGHTGQCEVPCTGAAAGASCDNGSGSPAICCDESGGTLACTTGNCCSNSDCNKGGVTDQTCQNSVCTTCPPVTDGHYYVDPYNGSDSQNGGGTTCPFKTLTKAMGLARGATSATIITVRPTAVLGAGETYPIVLPEYVMVEGALTDAGAPPVIQLPATATYGFELNAASSGLSHLLIQPAAGNTTTTAAIEIAAGSVGAGATETSISYVTVSGMPNTGVAAASAAVLGPAFIATGNGTQQASSAAAAGNGLGSGLTVTAGVITLQGGAGALQSQFAQNGEDGIYVTGSGAVQLAGSGPATATSADVTVTQNHFAGVWVAQTVATPPLTSLNGIQVTATRSGDGIRVYAGSSFTLRNSYLAGNSHTGIYVTTAGSTTVTGIDLGSGTSAGGNTFQETNATVGNAKAGLCLTFTPAEALLAEGNHWGAAGTAINCAASSATLDVDLSSGNCGAFADVGFGFAIGKHTVLSTLATVTGCSL